MHRLVWLLFVLGLAASATFIVATTYALPDQVASHFGTGNAPNAFMTRDGYLAFILAFALVLPVFLATMMGLLPRRWPNSVNLPNRDYWLDPKRRDATMNALATQGAWLGILTTLFIAGLHYVLLVANEVSPPRLPPDLFRMLLIGFVVAIALWIGALFLRFRNVR